MNRAKVCFSLPDSEATFCAIVDSGSEANVVSMDFVTESNLSRYLRPQYNELFPIGDKMLPSNFEISLPIKFLGQEEFQIVDFLVLNLASEPVLGQPWLRERDLCVDIGFSSPDTRCVRTSKASPLDYFSTPIFLQSYSSPLATSLATQSSRYSVPFVTARIAGQQEELLLDTGAMVNILSEKKYNQIKAHNSLKLKPSRFGKLKGAGTWIPVLGQVTLDLEFTTSWMGYPTRNRPLEGSLKLSEIFLVAKDPGDDFTLGLNFFVKRCWLLDSYAAALVMLNGNAIRLHYPRDKNLTRKQVDHHVRKQAVKVHLASLGRVSTLVQCAGLRNLAQQCMLVAKHYEDLMANTPQSTIDLEVLLQQPQFGAEAYHRKMVYKWLYDHPGDTISHMWPNPSQVGHTPHYPDLNFDDDLTIRIAQGSRSSDDDHQIAEGLKATRNLLFPKSRVIRINMDSPPPLNHPPLEEPGQDLSLQSLSSLTSQQNALQERRVLTSVPEEPEHEESGSLILKHEGGEEPSSTCSHRPESDPPLDHRIETHTPPLDSNNDPHTLALKQPHTGCTNGSSKSKSAPPDVPATIQLGDEHDDQPHHTQAPLPPYVPSLVTDPPLREFFDQQMAINHPVPKAIEQPMPLEAQVVATLPSPSTSQQYVSTGPPNCDVEPFLANRP